MGQRCFNRLNSANQCCGSWGCRRCNRID